MTVNRTHSLFSGTRILVVAALTLLVPPSGVLAGSMYMCREKSGAMNFTNAPVGNNCREYSLSQSSGIRITTDAVSSSDSTAYDHDIRRIGRRYQIEPTLIKAIIQTESAFNHRAVSRRGAQGLMQLMPDTARELRVANPFNPLENIDGGTRYLRQLLDSFNGDLKLSLAAYNAGPGLVSRTGGIPNILETQQYVVKVIRQYKEYKRLNRNGFLLVKE